LYASPAGSGAEPQLKSNFMTSGGFNDFPEILPTGEITTKTEKSFLVFTRPWP